VSRDPLRASLRGALAACAGCGWLAASLVLLGDLEPEGAWLQAVGCLAWLVFVPLYEAELAGWIGRVPRIGGALARGVWVLEVVPVVLLPTPLADSLIFGSMILAQGHLFLACDDDRNAARCLAAAPLVNVIALAYARSFALLCLLPVSALTAIVALVLLQGRAAQRRVQRGAPTRETAAGVRGRLAYALPLGLFGLVASVALFVALALAIEEPPPPERPPLRPLIGGAPSELPSPEGDGSSDNGIAPEMAFGNSTMPFSDAVVLRLTPGSGAAAGGAVHLRDMVLDTFTAESVRLGDRRVPPTLEDGDDGTVDGWVSMPPRDPSRGTRRYHVEARRLYLSAQEEWTLLFAPQPLTAIRLPSVAYDPDKVLYTAARLPEWFEYDLEVLDRDTSPTVLLELGRARRVDGRYLALPPRSPALAEIEGLAAEWTLGAQHDYEVVRAVVERLRTDFEYELKELEFRGPEALLEFLRRRSGYCTYFASAAVMMLRTRGIPARVATGFLAHEWDDGAGGWVVRERDAHAWIEVAFRDVGWVTFDPTPPDTRERAADAGLEPLEEDPTWRDRASGALESWLDGDGTLGTFVKEALTWPVTLLRRAPQLWLLPSALLLLLLHLLLRGRRRADRNGGLGGLPARAQGLFQRLATALAELGHLRRPGQTPREFAAALPGDEAFGGVSAATELYYRARYGAQPLGEDEERFVERLVLGLEGLGAARPDLEEVPTSRISGA